MLSQVSMCFGSLPNAIKYTLTVLPVVFIYIQIDHTDKFVTGLSHLRCFVLGQSSLHNLENEEKTGG